MLFYLLWSGYNTGLPLPSVTDFYGDSRRLFNLDPMSLQFDRRANSYSQAAVVQQRLAAWLAEWLEPLEQTRLLSALELGPADGLFTSVLAPRFRCLRAMDIAPRMIERGRCQLPQVEWCVGDGRCPEGPSVDRLYSASFLQWCDEPITVLRRWRTLAKEGARMLHGFYVAPTLSEWQSVAPGRSPIAWRNPSEWLELFREAGWRVLRSDSCKHTQPFASAMDLVRFFHQTGATTSNRTPVGELRQAISAYDQQFAIANGSTGVKSTWTFFRIEVEKEG